MANPENKARETLQTVGVTDAPVDVELVAKQMGCKVMFQTLKSDLSGLLVNQPGKCLIGVNSHQSKTRQRFTIAHELGHYFFHDGLEQHVDQDFRIAWRNADSSKAVNWTEIEANQFAAQLLMPTAFMQDDLNELQVIDKRAVLLLAGKYIVSREAMTIRLSQLGLTGPY